MRKPPESAERVGRVGNETRKEVKDVEKDKQMNTEGSGTLECMDHAAAVMLYLGSQLAASDEKVRVTIERDPETKRFVVKREVVPYR